MAYTPLAARRLTPEQEAFLRVVPDDTEAAPWMVMGSGQFWAATRLAESLETYVQDEGLGWFVGGMLPILYREPGTGRQKQVSPDVLVALVERRERQSYDLEEEGIFPAFVVEVASPDSEPYDDGGKRTLYDLLGAEEYALFAPGVAGRQETRLWGYRRGAGGTLEAWEPDAAGRLWSEVLGLYLVERGRHVRAARLDGQLLPTLQESLQARRQAEEQRAQAEAERDREAAARRRAEDERRRVEAARAQEATARRRAEDERDSEAAARRQAEAARAQAEVEVARLRAELARRPDTDAPGPPEAPTEG